MAPKPAGSFVIASRNSDSDVVRVVSVSRTAVAVGPAGFAKKGVEGVAANVLKACRFDSLLLSARLSNVKLKVNKA